MSYFEDVVRWHKAVGHPVKSTPRQLDHADLSDKLSRKLIKEEISELLDSESVEDTADGIADSIWVLCGHAARSGIDLDAVWDVVRRANFDKIGGPIREDGKRLKPEGWRPPDIEFALSRGRDLNSIK